MTHLLDGKFHLRDYTKQFLATQNPVSAVELTTTLHNFHSYEEPSYDIPDNILEQYCYDPNLKKCDGCNNQIVANSNSEFCSYCDVSEGEKPFVFGIEKCVNCSQPFEMHHLHQHSCLDCKPNLLCKLSKCLKCADTYIRTENFQLFCEKPDCNEESYIATLPPFRFHWQLLKSKPILGQCVCCTSKFITLSETTQKCAKCSDYGGEIFNYRTIFCPSCNSKETTARTHDESLGDKNNLCNSCFNISQNNNRDIFFETIKYKKSHKR